MANRRKRILCQLRTARKQRGVLRQLLDLIIHKLRINTRVADYYRYGFFDPAMSWDEKSRYVGQHGSRFWPFATNALRYNAVITNKYLQKVVLAGLDLPIPTLLATVGNHCEISSFSQFQVFLGLQARDLAFKPMKGTHGRGFNKIEWHGDHYVSRSERVDPEALWESLKLGLEVGYVVEEAVRNSDTIARFNSSSLNTFRVITFKLARNRWIVIGAALKVGRAGSLVDNSSAGGLFVPIEDDGRTGLALNVSENTRCTHHPDSQVLLKDIAPEGLNEALELALRASRKLSFMGTLGWDIAPTKQGPIILEANAFYAVDLIQTTSGGLITDEMLQVLEAHGTFSRWDKMYMYPGFNIKHSSRRLLKRLVGGGRVR